MSKFRDLLRNKTAVIIAAAMLLLIAAVITASLTGVFSGKGKSIDAATGNAGAGTNTPNDGTGGAVRTAGLLDTAVEIAATDQDSLGVSTTSAFRLLFSRDTDESAVFSSLSVEPDQSFSIKQVSGKEFSLEFDKPLQSNKIYNITLNDRDNGAKRSWAFQTKKQFNVLRTLPRDQSTYVPVNTGIEITFSHDGVKDPEKYFEITPEVRGRFEWNKKTLIFVPESLEQDTVYTVRIKKDIGVEGSDETLQSDFVFSFQTELPTVSRKYFSFSDQVYNFTPQTVPALSIYTHDDMAGSEVPVEIYSYPDEAAFMTDLKKVYSRPYWAVSKNDGSVDTASLKKAASATATIVKYTDSYWSKLFLLLPSSLPEGYYLVKTDIDGYDYYARVQINKTSVYIMTTNDKYLAWLNDTVTGQPISGASVIYDDGSSASTDSNGLAVLDAHGDPGDAPMHFFMIKTGSSLPFAACVPNYTSTVTWYSYHGNDVTNNYWTYMYLDRGMYLPQDTINVWGIIKPRDGSSMSNEAVLELIRYGWYAPDGDSLSVLESQNVTLSPDGTFTGSLKTSNYNPGSYEVRLRIVDMVMATRYLQISEYTKPTYIIEAKPDRRNIFAWETVDFDITASFFEGTPAPGLRVDYTKRLSHYDTSYGSLTSDIRGKSHLTLKPQAQEEGWDPVRMVLSLRNGEAEEQQTVEYQYINVFPKDTMVEVETKTENGIGTVSLTTSRIDLSDLDNESYSYLSPDDYRGASVDIPVRVKLYERYYEKRKTGDYYDHINKVRRDIYEYDLVHDLIEEFNFNTVNGKYELKYTADKDKHYTIEVYAADSAGRSIFETIYIYNWDGYDPYNSSTYSLSQNDVIRQYRTGETVRAEVRYNRDQTNPTGDRRYLFIRMQNGIMDYRVSGNPVYEFAFDRELIPNVYVKALCFDGSGIYDAGINQYRYDYGEKKLNIAVTPDKPSYRPGEEVKLTIEVKDGDGNPVSAEVNISTVDEAFFALYDQYVDTLGSLYGMNIWSGLLSEYLSYEPVEDFGPPMAEGGGEGGGDMIRKDFKDTAVFLTISTDASGRAEAAFRMPDNLTSWRVTCQAVTNELEAGTSVININSKLPFFVDSIFNRNFITGDAPSILVRANGEELAEGADVDFTVTVTDAAGTSSTYTAKGKANLHSEIQLGTLAKGEYTVRIEGTSGSLRDAMERTFRVTDSLLETSVTDIIPLTEGVSMANGVKGLTTLTFYNEDSSVLYNELRTLYWSWGSRIDQVLARKISGKLLQNYFNEELYIDEEFDLTRYQTDDGGLALLTYDSSNPKISAQMCSLAADSVDKGALAYYFYNLIDDEKTAAEDVLYAYWGLAALREPVLLDIKSMLAQDGTDLKTRLILGAALAEAGDHQGALEIYNEAMKTTGTVTGTFAWVDAGTRDDTIEATALCTLIAMKTNAPEKMKLFNYISQNSTSTLLVNLERMIFVTNYIKEASLVSSFTYELDGVKKRIELEKGGYFRIVLTPDKLAAIKFSNITGNILTARSCTAPVSKALRTPGDIVSIDRSYGIGGLKDDLTDFKRSDTVRVTLALKFSENAPDGYYEITDILPAGFRYIDARHENAGMSGLWYYPHEVTGQKVVFGYYYSKEHTSEIRALTYYAKAVSPGTYTADSAALRHTDKDIAGFSDAANISIR